MIRNTMIAFLLALGLVSVLLAGCAADVVENDAVQVLATTTIVGDVARQVAGDYIEVQVLLPVGSDPHSFQPTPQDLAAIEEADLILLNGFGLETFLGDLLDDNAGQGKLVEVSQGITPLYFGESAAEHAAHADEEGDEHAGIDPHVWMSPQNVLVWVENIAAALTELDPAHAEGYQARAEAYRQELLALDEWAREQFSAIPPERRLLVSDHETFNYLAQAYDLEVVGALTGFSSLAESSAQELAALEDAINELDVQAIFVSSTVPAILAERVAGDTGVQVVRVYEGSLSEVGGAAASYLEMMRDTIAKMAAALQ